MCPIPPGSAGSRPAPVNAVLVHTLPCHSGPRANQRTSVPAAGVFRKDFDPVQRYLNIFSVLIRSIGCFFLHLRIWGNIEDEDTMAFSCLALRKAPPVGVIGDGWDK